MYKKPILTRLGKLRDITKRLVALEPFAGVWFEDLPDESGPPPSAVLEPSPPEPVRSREPAASRRGVA